jgi:hypothetical protein
MRCCIASSTTSRLKDKRNHPGENYSDVILRLATAD